MSKFKTFTLLNKKERKEWIAKINNESFIYDIINLLEFFLTAVYYVNQQNAIRIK